ncbi:hypothetical protein BC936DRAFT_148044 [Jimgerdemannia flammicorona]|uniref:Uncharacterized protein n=1 Tax=Jimgerdemannia flammicorona TaxID=994334 RepID=A0A433D3X4_9FUNG|nr:hypothetical protein BC936DRAFT_148044 [Jimgerdemannia flammicorona]
MTIKGLKYLYEKRSHLLPVPHGASLCLCSMKEGGRLCGWRAPWHIDVDRNNAITAADNRVGVVVVAAAVRARAHGNDPAGLWHLVVNLAERWGHLVGEGAGDDHDVGLAWGGAEDDAKTILVVARGGDVHHLDSAASEA